MTEGNMRKLSWTAENDFILITVAVVRKTHTFFKTKTIYLKFKHEHYPPKS